MLFELTVVGKPTQFNEDIHPDATRAFVAFKLTGPMDKPSPDRLQWGAWVNDKSTEQELDETITNMALALLKPHVVKEMEKTFVN